MVTVPTKPTFIILAPVTVSENVFVKELYTNPRHDNNNSEKVQRSAALNLLEHIFVNMGILLCVRYITKYTVTINTIVYLLFINMKLHSHMFQSKPAGDQQVVKT
jgi:hypothetical protein